MRWSVSEVMARKKTAAGSLTSVIMGGGAQDAR